MCIFILLFSWFLFNTSNLAFAQLERLAGARTLGLNGCNTALSSDIWGLFSNPANIGGMQAPEINTYFERRYNMAELQYLAFGAVYPIKNQHYTGAAFSSFGWEFYKTHLIGLNYTYHLLNIIHLGIRLNYANTIIPNYGNWNSFLVDIGGNAALSKKVNIAFKVMNANQAEILGDKLPTEIAIGLKYQPSKKVKILTEWKKSHLFPVSFCSAVEYQPLDYLIFRTGSAISSNRLPAPNNYFVTSSFGIGFFWQNIIFDLAAQWHDRLGITPAISLGYQFTKKPTK
ncbi:MAG: hypothetical protein KatS3mg035_0191 [Bacteroidia bacterium]|nr:MAG: hypothetical protein KatS3mg035_0191 [Bacteroidia bacterium]